MEACPPSGNSGSRVSTRRFPVQSDESYEYSYSDYSSYSYSEDVDDQIIPKNIAIKQEDARTNDAQATTAVPITTRSTEMPLREGQGRNGQAVASRALPNSMQANKRPRHHEMDRSQDRKRRKYAPRSKPIANRDRIEDGVNRHRHGTTKDKSAIAMSLQGASHQQSRGNGITLKPRRQSLVVPPPPPPPPPPPQPCPKFSHSSLTTG